MCIIDYLFVVVGDYFIDVVVDSDNSVVVIDDVELMLEVGMFYIVIVNNVLVVLEFDVFVDMFCFVVIEVKVCIVYVLFLVGNVDIYVIVDGEIDVVDLVFVDIVYEIGDLVEIGYVSFVEGDYVVMVILIGIKIVVIEIGVLMFENGEIYIVIVLDGVMEGDLF